ncbi:MAG TPA: hypothetical protein VND91_04655 [Candidatus Saccharimonadia bacterium]|nr:hypothetical protein [Candidatus Saccharimonadia bacterium]
MKFVPLAHATLLAAAFLLAPAAASAQSAAPGTRPAMPSLGTRAAPPSRPADVGDARPPGLGGTNGPGTRGNGNGPDNSNRPPHARGQLPRLINVCGPGGALSGEAEHGQIGRNRARLRVCGD